MITEAEVNDLRIKALPPGGTRVVEIINRHRDRVAVTSVALENVPLVIVARHGMIARLPVNGTMQKLSQGAEIAEALSRFFSGHEMLYLYVNLPAIPVPEYVKALILEVSEKMRLRDSICEKIDDALIRGDRAAFRYYTDELRRMNEISHKE